MACRRLITRFFIFGLQSTPDSWLSGVVFDWTPCELIYFMLRMDIATLTTLNCLEDVI